METSEEASGPEDHLDRIQARYPKYRIVPLYTYEHSGMRIDRFLRCQFDSSSDAFGGYLRSLDNGSELLDARLESDKYGH